jgi:predicted component of type VI protein secretion system
MQVILRVVGGKNNGREIKISVPEFIIGRGEEAHLRPSSDLVSRNHCAIRVADGKVTLVDNNSRNGTFVNGKQLKGSHDVRSGDSLRVGRLQFELLVDPAKAGNKKAKVNNVVEAAARTAQAAPAKSGNLEDSITDWLTDLPDNGKTVAIPLDVQDAARPEETIQMSMSETQTILDSIEKSNSEAAIKEADSSIREADSSDDGPKTNAEKKKKGKLPPLPKTLHQSSTTAADDVLKKFFNRR